MDKYVLIEPKLAYYRSQWLSDYIVYYGLPAEYLKGTYNNENEEALYCLINCKEMSDEELFPAISRLSSYNIEASAFYKEYADDCRQAVCRVYRAWAEYYSKHRKYSLDWHLFGVSVKRVITLFQNAVFFDTRESPDGVFEFSKLCRYQCENGIWTLENYPTGIRKNADLGAVVKETDLIMRREYGYKKQLKETFDNKTVIKIITKEVTGLIEEKRKNAVPEVVIDLSSLDRIRRDADITRDKLLTEEEILPETETAVTPAEDIPEESGLLEKKEREFLSLILSGGDVKAFALKEGVMISMLCESINEKLYDSFGDIVIDFADDVPMIIDDYIEEIKELL